MTAARTPFKLVRPCAKCPFRTDVPGYLRRARAAQIARDIAEGSIFSCHETTVDGEGEDGEETLVAGEESQFCAGALITMEKMESANQAMRMAERISLYDPTRLDMSAPVVSSFIEFVDHHDEFETLLDACKREEDGEEMEDCCEIAEANCESPAGYLVGGMVVPGESDAELHLCPECGRTVCDSCSNDEGVCAYCTEEPE